MENEIEINKNYTSERNIKKIACIGGTGNLGEGLCVRLSILGYDVIVGSRKQEKAEKIAEKYNTILAGLGYKPDIIGLPNEKAAEKADVAILTVPWEHAFAVVEDLRDFLADKIVVSPLVPMKKADNSFIFTPPPEGSAAEKVARILGHNRVVSAYHTLPARKFANINAKFTWDVVVCGDDRYAKEVVIDLTNKMGLNALDGGPLMNSRIVESLTPLILNIMARNKMKEISVKFM